MSDTIRDYLSRQFEIAWALTDYHLATLSDDECRWRPAARGLHVKERADGTWQADWPEHEGYDLGPSSMAWLTWHLVFWWSMVLDHSFAAGTLEREAVRWPGSAEAVRQRVAELKARWQGVLANLDDAALASSEHSHWPFADRPFGDVVAWVNIELTKSAAELGYARFLYALRAG